MKESEINGQLCLFIEKASGIPDKTMHVRLQPFCHCSLESATQSLLFCITQKQCHNVVSQ